MNYYVDMKGPFTGWLMYELNVSTFMTRHSYMNFNNPGATVSYVDHQYPTQLKLGVL